MRAFHRAISRYLTISILSLFICSFSICLAYSDVIINVLAVNGAESKKTTDIKFNLPAEVKPEDVLDSDGLRIEYDINAAGYFLTGAVELEAQETKTFRVRVKDVWKVTEDDITRMQDKINEGFKQLTLTQEEENAEKFKNQLANELQKIVESQSERAEDVERRMDAYRTYMAALKRIEQDALSIDYWGSDPEIEKQERVFSYVIEVENPVDKPDKVFKQRHPLLREVKPEHMLALEGYEMRFDASLGQPFLYKEEEIKSGETKRAVVAIEDVWYIKEQEINYINEKVESSFENLKDSKFGNTAKYLYDSVLDKLSTIKESQIEKLNIHQHIGLFRTNEGRLADAKESLEELDKLLALYREEQEKSKIKNVLQRIRSLKSLAKVSQAIFDKKPKVNAAWKIIGAVVVFLGIFTIIHFATWFIRSNREKMQEEEEKKKLNS